MERDTFRHHGHDRFTFADGQFVQFEIDRERRFDPAVRRPEAPTWTGLEFHQCSNCPLTVGDCRHCPVALDLAPVVSRFRDAISHTRVRVEVVTPERTYLKDCDVQTGLRSLLGLIMATSACPVLASLKGLAATHLPFATLEESVLRTVGSYLLRQYFLRRDGQTADLELNHLRHTYDQIGVLNRCFADRVAAASEQDANLNALYSLLCVAEGMSASLLEQLEELRPLLAK